MATIKIKGVESRNGETVKLAHFETFSNIHTLLKTLDSRPQNKAMEEKNQSKNGSIEFTKTNSYEEATDLLRFGYTEILDKIQSGVKKNLKDFSQDTEKNRPINLPIGFVPNVPNAIRNLPNSMIAIDKKLMKTKTFHLCYIFGGSCCVDAEEMQKAGITLISALALIERMGLAVKLDVCFMPAFKSSEVMIPCLTIKDYNQPFDLKKLCFPLAHPSMFRRIGFKYLETSPDRISNNFSDGYGSPLENWVKEDAMKNVFQQVNNKKEDFACVTTQTIRNLDGDVQALIDIFNNREGV